MTSQKRSKFSHFITQDESAQYFEVGYSCDNAILLCLGDERVFITDARYTTEASENLSSGVELVQSNNLLESAINILSKSAIKSLSFDSTQLSVSAFEKLKSALQIELKPAPNFHQMLRICKSEQEISLIKESQRLNKEAYKRFAKIIDEICSDKNSAYQKVFLDDSHSLSEKELFAIAKVVLENGGKYDLSFCPILAINQNAAKPHALPSDKKLQNGDLLLFDAGIKYKRYCSDMTRTTRINFECEDFARKDFDSRDFECKNGGKQKSSEAKSSGTHFDKSQTFANKELQKIYDTVLKAQENCIKNLRAGMSGKQIDALARGVIEKAGFGKYFSHSTGHGIGLDIHEQPFISTRSETIIEDNMVFSIEPGIYIPQHYGVRIEDLVVVRGGKAEVL